MPLLNILDSLEYNMHTAGTRECMTCEIYPFCVLVRADGGGGVSVVVCTTSMILILIPVCTCNTLFSPSVPRRLRHVLRARRPRLDLVFEVELHAINNVGK